MFRVSFIFPSLLSLFGLVSAAYVPPQAKVEPLYPEGIRISIPHEHGISLVAFHVRINQEFKGVEAEIISVDVLRVQNGRWMYQDSTTQLKFGDKVSYWVHVVYEGNGYNLLFQEHKVTDFYHPDGSRVDIKEKNDPESADDYYIRVPDSICPPGLFPDNYGICRKPLSSMKNVPRTYFTNFV